MVTLRLICDNRQCSKGAFFALVIQQWASQTMVGMQIIHMDI
jgi:hypothetical protein